MKKGFNVTCEYLLSHPVTCSVPIIWQNNLNLYYQGYILELLNAKNKNSKTNHFNFWTLTFILLAHFLKYVYCNSSFISSRPFIHRSQNFLLIILLLSSLISLHCTRVYGLFTFLPSFSLPLSFIFPPFLSSSFWYSSLPLPSFLLSFFPSIHPFIMHCIFSLDMTVHFKVFCCCCCCCCSFSSILGNNVLQELFSSPLLGFISIFNVFIQTGV